MNEENDDGLTIIMCGSDEHAPLGPRRARVDDLVCPDCYVVAFCKAHEELFVVRVALHLGENPEGFAYGCPRCDYIKFNSEE